MSFNFAPFASRDLVPYTFGDRVIKYRFPYTMHAELLIGANGNETFREDVFRNTIDKPFEIWKMRCLLTAVDAATPPVIYEPQPTTLDKRIRLMVKAQGLNQDITKVPTLVEHLMDDESRWWQWHVPHTIENNQGMEVNVTSLAFPTYCIPDPGAECALAPAVVNRVRVEITFQGFLIVVAPATWGTAPRGTDSRFTAH